MIHRSSITVLEKRVDAALGNVAVVYALKFGLVLLLASFSGCGESPGPELVPVIGEAYYGTVPAEGAMVVLHPVNDDERTWPYGFPMATVGSDGSFHVENGRWGEGAPAGTYKILVTWPEASDGANADPEAPELQEATDRLEGRFSDPATTPLAVTVENPRTEVGRLELENAGS